MTKEALYQKRRGRGKRKRLIRKYIYIGIIGMLLFAGIKMLYQSRDMNQMQLSGGDYPESLCALLERNAETRGFVLAYPQNKDKDFKIDLSDEVKKGTIPLFLQWDTRWGYKKYGSDFLAVTGCGPVCLSMVCCGLSGETEWNPLVVARMAQEQGFYVEGSGSSWELMTTGAAALGLSAKSVIFDKEHILAELKNGRPVICAMGPGDFTTTGHFIVLSDVDEENKIIVCDPNSRKNSRKHWEVTELMPQIKNLWSYTYLQ